MKKRTQRKDVHISIRVEVVRRTKVRAYKRVRNGKIVKVESEKAADILRLIVRPAADIGFAVVAQFTHESGGTDKPENLFHLIQND